MPNVSSLFFNIPLALFYAILGLFSLPYVNMVLQMKAVLIFPILLTYLNTVFNSFHLTDT